VIVAQIERLPEAGVEGVNPFDCKVATPSPAPLNEMRKQRKRRARKKR